MEAWRLGDREEGTEGSGEVLPCAVRRVDSAPVYELGGGASRSVPGRGLAWQEEGHGRAGGLGSNLSLAIFRLRAGRGHGCP